MNIMKSKKDEDFDNELHKFGYSLKWSSLWHDGLVTDYGVSKSCICQYKIKLNRKLESMQLEKQLLSNTLLISQEHDSTHYQCRYCSSVKKPTNSLFSHLLEKRHIKNVFQTFGKDSHWIYILSYCPSCKLTMLGDKCAIERHKRSTEHAGILGSYKYKMDHADESDEEIPPTYINQSVKRSSAVYDDISAAPKEFMDVLGSSLSDSLSKINISVCNKREKQDTKKSIRHAHREVNFDANYVNSHDNYIHYE